MEGKKFRALGQNCQAVSEVYGQLLMISIVVIAFSTIALTVFSDGGAVKPEHIPRIDLQENFKKNTNIVQIVHNGGEAIDLSAIKITFNVNGQKSAKPPFVSPFTVKNPDGSPSSDGVFTLGDCIEISTKGLVLDPTSPTGVRDPIRGDTIEMFFIDTPSQQVIQKAVLQIGAGELPYWITPHPYGSIYDNSTNKWLPTDLVDGFRDNSMTECQINKGNWTGEIFTFGIDEYGLDLKNPLTKVELKVVYTVHDNSQASLMLEINDKNPDEWISVVPSNFDLEDYKTIEETNKNCIFTLTPSWVTTPEELRHLTVRFSGYGNAASDKYFKIDFIGIHAE